MSMFGFSGYPIDFNDSLSDDDVLVASMTGLIFGVGVADNAAEEC